MVMNENNRIINVQKSASQLKRLNFAAIVHCLNGFVGLWFGGVRGVSLLACG